MLACDGPYGWSRQASVRAQYERTSEKLGILRPGALIGAVELRAGAQPSASPRVHFPGGWVSIRAKNGATLLELVGQAPMTALIAQP